MTKITEENKLQTAQHIIDYAIANYPTKRGQKRWDYVVETMSLEDIVFRFVDSVKTQAQAYKAAHEYAKLMSEVQE